MGGRRDGPGLRVVAPFFVVAPLGLLLSGVLLVGADEDVFLAVNAPRTVGVTHATVLGWLTLSIMGAVYQLGPAVFGGRLISTRLVYTQFVVHVIAVPLFVYALRDWDVLLMGVAATGVAVSLILFVINAVPCTRWFRSASVAQLYVSAALVFLVATAALGITFVGTLEHLWFPITQGRLSGHAHVGLVGWLGLMLMGVSYQLVPMFHVVPRAKPRFGLPALVATAAASVIALVGFSADPPMPARVLIAAGLSLGPGLWAVDMMQLLRKRSRRHMDIHGHALLLSLCFLGATMLLGILAAIGAQVAPGGEPARLLLAYGAMGIGGWAGTLLIGNSAKIVPFLVWNERYRSRAGLEPVPSVAELSCSTWSHTSLAVLTVAVSVVAAGALLGHLPLVRIGGGCLIAAGACHSATLMAIVFSRPRSSTVLPPTLHGPVSL